MNPSPTRSRRWARLSLLVAALLQFAGATVGSLAHAHGQNWSPRVTIGDARDEAPDAPAPHDELGCMICHAFTAVGIPGTGSTAPVHSRIVAAPGWDAETAHSAIQSPATRARAPPAV